MQLSPIGIKLLQRRYLKKRKDGSMETPEDLFWRVATSAAQPEPAHKRQEIAEKFYNLMFKLEFLPNSPTLINAGQPLNQLAACFVLPVEDSIEDIFTAVKNAALVHKSGGGTGFDFSKLRPKNTLVTTTGGLASGPVSFIKVFDAATTAIKQGGTRRGANMAVLRVDHPDILEFIEAKSKPGQLVNFNFSVGITDKFIKAVKENNFFPLTYKGKTYNTIAAKDILHRIAFNSWQNGEPGVLFLDTINATNPTPVQGFIAATNPCGEQPLLPYEACILGSINLEKMATQHEINWVKLGQVISVAIRFLDNLIDVSDYPLPEIGKITMQNRKIGLGIMGWANLLYKLAIPYDSQTALNLAEKVMSFIQANAHNTSGSLALEKGSFPAIDGSIYHGTPMRNATCTTIAPTGSLSLIADTSPGIEPVFALAFRKKALGEEINYMINPVFKETIEQQYSTSQYNMIMEQIIKTGSVQNCSILESEQKRVFVTAPEIPPEWHIRMQAAFQKFCDNAVSKTINLAPQTKIEEIENMFILAHNLKCKGLTVYRAGSRQKEAQQAGVIATNNFNPI